MVNADTRVKLQLNFGLFKVTLDSPLHRPFRSPRRKELGQQLSSLSRWVSERRGAVQFRIASYTSQSTLTLLSQLLRREAEALKERRVEIQILRPYLESPMKIWDVEREDDKRYWLAVRDTACALDRLWLTIPEQSHGDVSVQIRLHPFEPPIKAIVVNDEHALVGLYHLERHTKDVLGGITCWDYVGHRTILAECHATGSGIAHSLFDWASRWFDRTWTHFSVPVADP